MGNTQQFEVLIIVNLKMYTEKKFILLYDLCLSAHSFYIFIAVLLIPCVHATADPFTKEELEILLQLWFSIGNKHANPSL
jgi:hypothetical protein